MPGDRPHVLLSAAVSLDGHLDDAGPDRLILSTPADLDRVRADRADCDAILVGAGTVRSDDPSLTAGDAARHPLKVTVTASGDLDPAARFFTTGTAGRLVYAATPVVADLRHRLGDAAEIADAGERPSWPVVLADLRVRGVRRLMVEGGARVLTGLLTAGLADELRLAVAPFFVGDAAAPRFAEPGPYPFGPSRRMRLTEVGRVDDMAVLTYRLTGEGPST